MTFKKLFERLKESGLLCGVAEMHMEEMQNLEKTWNNYNFLRGYLWGLTTANLITDEERDELTKILTNFFD